MKLKDIKAFVLLTIVIVPFSITNVFASDSVEWTIQKTLQLEAVPNDVAVSPDGRRIFVLTDQGEIFIYSSTSKVISKIDVGKHVDKIQMTPKGDVLILNSRKNKTVQVITLDFIQNINISGSPFKGPENASIVIALFDDFQ